MQPAGKRNEVLGLIKQGLLDFSISRTSITWGIPLPWDERHVAYVWFDALINYCTAVGYADDRERFDRYWPANYHLIGKDILRLHAVYWPAMLMAAGEAPPQSVFAHGFLLVGGEKMSKTRSTRSRPPTSSPTSASTASATTSSPTSASVPTATSATRRWSRATTPTSPTTSATSPAACSTWP